MSNNTKNKPNFQAGIIVADGTLTEPSIRFGDDDSGFWQNGDGNVSVSANGQLNTEFNQTETHFFKDVNIDGNLLAANFPPVSNANTLASFDSTQSLVGRTQFSIKDAAGFYGMSYQHNVIPDIDNNGKTLHNNVTSFNPTAPDSKEFWDTYLLEAGVGTDDSGFQVGDPEDVKATLVLQDLTYTSNRRGADGNVISIEYVNDGTAGSETASRIGFAYTVHMESGVSTAQQIYDVIAPFVESNGNDFEVAITGTASNAQIDTAGPIFLTGGEYDEGGVALHNVSLYSRNKSNMGNASVSNAYFSLGNDDGDPLKANNVSIFGGNAQLRDNTIVNSFSIMDYNINLANSSTVKQNLRGWNISGNVGTVLNAVYPYTAGFNMQSAEDLNIFQSTISVVNVTRSVNAFADFGQYTGDIGDNYYGGAIQPIINTVGGFFGLNINPNVTLSRLSSTGLVVNMNNVNVYAGVKSSVTIQDIFYQFKQAGSFADTITVEYVNDVIAGSETASIAGTSITVHIESGVSTATQVLAAVVANSTINTNLNITITGTGSNPQVAVGPTNLAGGANAATKKAAELVGDSSVNGTFQAGGDFHVAPNNGLFQTHALGGGVTVDLGSPINGTFGFANAIGHNITFNDDWGDDGTSLSLGLSINAAANQIEGAAGKTFDALNYFFAGGSTGAGSTGGTINDLTMYRALGLIPQGGPLTINNMYGFKGEITLDYSGAANSWGVWIGATSVDNWFAKNVVIGGVTGKPTGSYQLDVTGDAVFSGGISSANDTIRAIDANNRSLIDTVNKVSINWQNRWLNDSSENTSVSWNSRELVDSGSNSSLNWEQRSMTDGGGNVMIEWGNYRINDTSGAMSIDWQDRELNDIAGNQVVNWANQITYDPTGSQSIDWTNRVLYGTTGNSILNYTDGLGVFGTAPVIQQLSSGAQTAGAIYTATEQTMIQEMYDALRAYGLLS